MNVAYKHLESKLKIGELTVLQWLTLFVGVMGALVWAVYVSPFGSTLTIITAVYLAGVPCCAAMLAGASSFDVWLHLRALSRHRRMVGRYVPGAGQSVHGYVIDPDGHGDREPETPTPDLDLTELWQ